jgi:hypothetical protein
VLGSPLVLKSVYKPSALLSRHNISITTEIHAQVAEKATRDRKAAIQKHDEEMHARSPNFRVGDYVLVAEQRKSGVSKLQVKVSTVSMCYSVWTRGGPRRKQSQANLTTLQWSIFCLILSGAHRGYRAFLATPLDLDLYCTILNSVR